MTGNPEDDLTPEQIDAMERKLLDEPLKPIVVETRSKHRRTKFDMSGFTDAKPAPVVKQKSRVPQVYEYYLYSPEYGKPYWIINRVLGGKRTVHRRCHTEGELRAELQFLAMTKATVTEVGK